MQNLKKKIERNMKNHQQNVKNTTEMLLKNFREKNKKTVWTKRRSRHWWNTIFNSQDYTEMFENFRMDKETFFFICDKLDEELKPNPLHIRESLSTKMKVAIAIFKLASCAEYRVVGNQFGVQKSTVKSCLYQFCNACIKVLLNEEIKMPVGEETNNTMQQFEQKSGLPQILGAIDGTHIPILPTRIGYRDYINRKGWPSLVLQAVVDTNYLFRDITCKHPGCTHDAAVFRDSFIYKNHQDLEWPQKVVDDKTIPAVIIGDPAYPLLPRLMKAYSPVHSKEEESFNVYLSKGRIFVENAFGRLKGRWRILQKRIDINVDFVPEMVATCCILHNILERRKIPYNASWNDSLPASGALYEQPSAREQQSNFEAEEIREHLKNYMSSRFPLLESLKN